MPFEYRNDDERQYFEHLDRLRESGETNMYGAAPYLVDEFGIHKSDARAILARWMETFSERQQEAG